MCVFSALIFFARIMERKCPCGKGFLRRKISNSEANPRRPYYKCTTSEKASLGMTSVESDRDACEFRMLITSSRSFSGSITRTLRSSQSHSQSSGSTSGGKRSNAEVYLMAPRVVAALIEELGGH
ncbi:hypothetical protein L1887_17790 [Cichorium endivia]|nr:hypothetical protein L1887_17790 [Cichorium endivia]